MTSSCREFRATLERHLTGEPSPENLTTLGWHEHLLGCGPCRELLEAEEALEYLLASLPEPKLPQHLVPRVLERLRDTREEASQASARLDRLLDKASSADATGVPDDLARSVLDALALDRLLERVTAEPVPHGLSGRVLSALAPDRERIASEIRRDATLDTLLDRVNTQEAPPDLHLRVLDALEEERFSKQVHGAAPREGSTILRLLGSPMGMGAAAAALLAAVALGLWGPDFWAEPSPLAQGDPADMARGPAQGEEQRPVPEESPAGPVVPAVEMEDLLPPELAPDTEVATILPGEDVAGPATPSEPLGPDPEAPDEELLAALDLLEDENWDLFFANDDVDLLLSAFEVSDELLLDIDALAPATGEPAAEEDEAERQG